MSKMQELWEHVVQWAKGTEAYVFFKEQIEGWRSNRLIYAIEHGDLKYRTKTAMWLAKKGGKENISTLIDWIGDSEEEIRQAGAEALVKMGPAAVPALMETLESWNYRANHREKGAAAEILGEIGDPRAFRLLIGALGDKNKEVRYHAACGLGKLGPCGHGDLEFIRDAGRNARKEGKPADGYAAVYSLWAKRLNEKAGELLDEKKFPIPKFENPEKINRVLRVRRLG